MSVELFGALVAVLLLAVPILVQAYVQRLPIAPTCPTCRAVTREVKRAWSALHLVPSLSPTFLGECTQCGWRGRMRWRWATRVIGGRGGR